MQGTPSTEHPPLSSSVLPLALVIRGLGCAMNLSGLECFQLEKSGSLLGEGRNMCILLFHLLWFLLALQISYLINEKTEAWRGEATQWVNGIGSKRLPMPQPHVWGSV